MSSPSEIKVTLPDGSQRSLPAGGTGLDLATAIGPGLAKAVVAARVKVGETTQVLDLQAALPDGAQVWLLKTDDPAALAIVRHSAEHILATAVCRLFPGAQVTMGPRDHDKEFYYDFSVGRAFTPEDLEKIEKEMERLVKEDVPFKRLEVKKPEAREIFKKLGQTYKDQILDWIPEDSVTVYQNHDFTDLCRGPHVPSSGRIKAFKLMTSSGAYWRGDSKNEMLQRITGVAFPNADALKKHLALLEEAKKRDHRKLGKELELFAFHNLAPASPFFLPKGAAVYNGLVDYVRKLYGKYGYQEVITPQVYDTELFKRSGHYDNYTEDMFFAYGAGSMEKLKERFGKPALAATPEGHPVDPQEHEREFGVKPMNCPGHCLIYAMGLHSHRDLPYRMADFGRLHRFELGGVIHGLTRVRTFCQDDGHVFCTPEQVQPEISEFIRFLDEVYRAFEFKDVHIRLATRPQKRTGTDEMWDAAEKALETALTVAERPFELAPGEGAFYGPKLEFHVKDALERSWQLGTIQVDYSMPDRFDLTFVGKDGNKQRAVMLHRAILGSLERFMGVYLEHIAGKFPAWLAPEQVRVLPITERAAACAEALHLKLKALGFRATLDARNEKLGFKIREAQLMQVPFSLVIGDKEVETLGVTVRQRGGKDLGFMDEAAVLAFLAKETALP
jgi:threonyl-tRNA synthetase